MQSQNSPSPNPQFAVRSAHVGNLNPFPWYAQMRAQDPVHFDEASGAWSVFRYDDVNRVISDHAAFSSRRSMAASGGGRERGSILAMDPPRHNQLRALVSQAFTARAIEQLAANIQAIVDAALDAVASSGRMDIVADLAYPLPATVIADMLDVPRDQQATFKRWSEQIAGFSNAEAAEASMGLESYFRSQLARRKDAPGEDLIGRLMQARVDGVPLTDDEIVDFCSLLLVAGNETTTMLIGNALWTFTDQPEVMEQLRAQPELLPGAIEEVLRYRSPVQRVNRRTLADIAFGGKTIPAGQMIFAWLGSANRDETVFPDPDTFDIRRDARQNLAFGHGVHACLGAPLAKLEAEIALRTLLERFRDIRRDASVSLEPAPSFFGLGLRRLPITFAAA